MASEPIDEKKILTDLSQRAIDRILSMGERKIRDYWARYKNRDVSTYADYLSRRALLARTVRHFVYNNNSVALYDIYVPAMVEGVEKTGDQFVQRLCAPSVDVDQRPTRALAIVGKAGAGKSLFMRHAFFLIQNHDPKRIPVLVDFRSFNRVPLADLETRIYEDMANIAPTISREQVSNGLRSGLFVILLDGMDELRQVVQAHYHRELEIFLLKFPLCPVLVSSRPSQKMLSLPMDVRPIAPLSRDAVEELIEKLDYDEAVKSAFIQLLRRRLYETHHEFVSTPLLCVIMLLTFADSGRIADNRHEFFEDAFTALWFTGRLAVS